MTDDLVRLFKNLGKDSQELGHDADGDATVELSESREDEQLAKLRIIDMNEMEELTENCVQQNSSPGLIGNTQICCTTLVKIHGDIFSGDMKQEFIGCQMLRKILSCERNPPIDSIITSGIVPKCVELLKSPNFDTQFEATWIILNIAAGNSSQTKYIVQTGAIIPLFELLGSTNPNLVELSIWALGNIAGDGPELRDVLIREGIVPPLVALARAQTSSIFLPILAWTLLNLCRRKPSPPSEAIRQIVSALAHLINLEDMRIIPEVCWALSYLADGSNEAIDEVLKANVLPRLAQLLTSTESKIIGACLHAIGNIAEGNDYHTDAVLAAGSVVQTLGQLLKSPKPTISKEAAWVTSNITAGTINQINAVINGGLVPILIHVMNNGYLEAKVEAVQAITNITSRGAVDHIAYLCQNGAIPAFCALFKCKDWNTSLVAMDGVENILKSAAGIGELAKIQVGVKECGGLDILKQLHHEGDGVNSKAFHIVEKYFSDNLNVQVVDMMETEDAG